MGQACDVASDCMSSPCAVCATGNCVDGLCCSSTCEGSCVACDVVPGQCTPVARGKAGTPTCAPGVCDGLGACTDACTSNGDCSNGNVCKDGACVPSSVAGAPCTRPDECGTGFCVDGVCCGSACAGQCEACDVLGSAGTCVGVAGVPHGRRPACSTGTDACSARTCVGARNRATCVGYAGDAVVCRAASCVAGVETREARCDGAGQCTTAETQVTRRCAPYACGEDACKSRCASDADCDAASACDVASGTCVAGTSCIDDHTLKLDAERRVDCSPYACRGSRCLPTCASVDDCVSPNVCTPSGVCEPRNAIAPEDGNACACRSVGGADAQGGGYRAFVTCLVGLVAFVRRRRAS
ncbi:MAG: hypothetical protein U0169_04760 [Polyangiaceae bacterium]